MKYICFDNNILVFGDQIKHSDFRNLDPTSAGFISRGDSGWNCYGDEKNTQFGYGFDYQTLREERESRKEK